MIILDFELSAQNGVLRIFSNAQIKYFTSDFACYKIGTSNLI